jgi:hypothetical protein
MESISLTPVAHPFLHCRRRSKRFRYFEQIGFAAQAAETVVSILSLPAEVRAKMGGTRLADVPWRPVSPEATDALAGSHTKRWAVAMTSPKRRSS